MTDYPYGIMSIVNNDTARRKIENILQHQDLLEQKFPVLDHGYVKLVDFYGSDEDIARAAWTSTEGAIDKKSPVPQFVDYLMRHKHSGPFQFAGITLEVKAPLFVIRQWQRHRTWTFNEASGRYTELPNERYEPERWRVGNTGHNKQGSSVMPDPEQNEWCQRRLREYYQESDEAYAALRDYGAAPELARVANSLGQYTVMVATVDLWNLFHFLHLRMDGHAQWEMRAYANTINNAIAWKLFPAATEAWANHIQGAVAFSRDEREVLRELLAGVMVAAGGSFDQAAEYHITESGLRKSRQDELLAKLKKVLND